jgi:2-desacetyl-2-hydroxyethyl bacteriochlorophyllide A dehydrogenase
MRAAVIGQPGDVRVRDVGPPEPGSGALVRVEAAGVCGTDLKIAAGEVAAASGRILGHEITGRVELAGPRGRVAAGTRVLVNPAVFCGDCDLCRRDLPQLCRRGGLLGRESDGGFAEFVAVDERNLHPLPDGISAAEAALLQVLSTCVHAQSGLALPPDAAAVVVGLGVSGLLHIQLLRASGVRTIVGVTRSAWKRDIALRSGASAVVAPDEAADVVAKLTGGRGADVAIECAGTAATLTQAMHLAGAGGTVVMFGTTAPAADGMPTYDWYLKELTIRCPRAARPRDCDTAVRLCADCRLDLEPLVTARFPVERISDALTACRDPRQLKVVLDIG